MGREVRRVPADWQHPLNQQGRYIPLHDGLGVHTATWDQKAAAWARGEFPDYVSEANKHLPYEEWDAPRPDPKDYMPDWPVEQRTHWQMYETCTEGTPISPVMETPEALAHWLADTGASAFGGMTATYEEWLHAVLRGFSIGSFVVDATGKITTGVGA